MDGSESIDNGRMTTDTNGLSKRGNSSDEIASLKQRATEFLRKSKTESTHEAYANDWRAYTDWCDSQNIDFLPATTETIALWVTQMTKLGRSVATIERSLVSISQAHKLIGLDSPTSSPVISELLKGVKRDLGVDQRQAKPLIWSDLKKVLDSIIPNFLGRRDMAILLVGWAAAMRRSEIVALDFEDIEFVPEGMVVTIRRSKTDQEGRGYKIGIPFGSDDRYCPTLALRKWIDLARIESGPLFFAVGFKGKWFYVNTPNRTRLGARMINQIIKRHVRAAGFSPGPYSGHSLRSGFVTSAAAIKIPEYQIQLHTRHLDPKTLRGYIRNASLFTENSLSLLI